MGEDVPTIQARQGSDPVVLSGFTLPASAGEKVAVGTMDEGLPTRSGKRARLLRSGDAGINPCRVGGVQCFLCRDYKDGTADGTTYYLHRAEDGEAVDIPNGTELETFAALHYRGKGVHIFWMGANGGYGTSESGLEFAGLLTRLKQCVDFAGVKTYFIVYARERRGYAGEAAEIEQLMDTFGEDHVINLLPPLAERGLLYAETGGTWDGEMLNGIPRVLDAGDGLHYSFYGYQAVAGIIWERLASCLYKDSGAQTPEPVGDEIGPWAYKLRKPKVLAAGHNGYTVPFQPYRTAGQKWTIAVKYKEDLTAVTPGDNITLLWMESKTEGLIGRCGLFIESDRGCTEPMCMLGNSGFRIDPTNFTLSRDGYHYVTMVRDGSRWAAWLDGNWMYGLWMVYDMGDLTSQETLVLGTMKGVWSMAGEITDLRIYDQALDDPAVKQLYQLMRGGEQT